MDLVFGSGFLFGGFLLPGDKGIQDQMCDCLYKYNAAPIYKAAYCVAAVWCGCG